jgi:protein-tyrosine phosphatase
MIDLHCHLMPGVDDGAASLNISIQMLDDAAKLDISAVCVTPHYSDVIGSAYERRFRWLVKQTASQPIRLLRGMEYRYSDLLTLDKFVTLGDSSYVLVDFVAPAIDLANVETKVMELERDGYKMVVAHPERLFEPKDIPALQRLVECGVVMQLNAGSFLGMHGIGVKQMAELMLSHGLCHVVASDSHGRPTRKLFIDKAINYFNSNYHKGVVDILFHKNSRLIIDDKPPQVMIPTTSQRSFSLLRRIFASV